MYQAEKLEIHPLGSNDTFFCSLLRQQKLNLQGKYLLSYLRDIDVKTVIIEPHYFDKNYLEEFAAFYSKSAYGHINKCKRIHFFSNTFDKEKFGLFLSNDPQINDEMIEGYLGFTAIRPINHAPFGTTVLKKYLDRENQYERIQTKRKYTAHIAGKSLTIEGLAWQQQDTAVGACATVALWTALSSSAFDDHHSIPTTAKITSLAHKTASLGSRVFPSGGLSFEQMCESIKENDLSPILIAGSEGDYFTKEEFLSSLCSYLRSGYPVIAMGIQEGYGHAICITGFREASFGESNDEVGFADVGVTTIYAHDDNIGPYVRFKIEQKIVKIENKKKKIVYLSPKAPKPYRERTDDITKNHPDFYPTMLLIAVHNDISISADDLNRMGLDDIGGTIANHIQHLKLIDLKKNSLTIGTIIIKGTNFLDEKLEELIENKKNLGRVRLDIWEKIRPMSLHIGIIRIGINKQPIMDVIFDTTNIPEGQLPIAHIVYSSHVIHILELIENFNLGERIEAF